VQINWAMHDKQELIDIVEVVYRGSRKGHGLVVSPKGARTCSASQSAEHLAREN
jgi:DIM1 family U5 snRNP protein